MSIDKLDGARGRSFRHFVGRMLRSTEMLQRESKTVRPERVWEQAHSLYCRNILCRYFRNSFNTQHIDITDITPQHKQFLKPALHAGTIYRRGTGKVEEIMEVRVVYDNNNFRAFL